MEINNVIAHNVKQAREQRGITLDSAAKLTGVSRSMLARIEKGDVNPTISVIWKIANGYKVSFTALIEEKTSKPDVEIIPKSKALIESDGLYINYPTFVFDEETKFEMYRIVIEENGSLQAQPHLKGAVEYVTVFSGQVEITVADKVYTLETGQSIRFNADRCHGYRSTGSGKSELSMLIYYS